MDFNKNGEGRDLCELRVLGAIILLTLRLQ